MVCKSCSSEKTEPVYYYNISAYNTIHYNITIDERTYKFTKSASASPGGNVHHIAVLNATKLAKGLTTRMAREHIKEFIKNTPRNTAGDKSKPSINYNNTTKYSVDSNDPRCSKNK